MSESLENLAKRLEDDPFFLACALRLYAVSDDISESQLAAALGCSVEGLTYMKLCRMPAGEPKAFQADVERIATKFGVRADALAVIARRGEVLLKLRSAESTSAAFMAARDRNDPVEDQP